MSTALLALIAPALAQDPADWQFTGTPVLEPDPSIAWASTTISNPSVVWDSNRRRYLMFFEAKTTQNNSHCPQGMWNVGVATSPDGVSWTMYSDPFVAGGTSYFSCVAAHPTAYYKPAYNPAYGNVYVYFKAEQRDDACARSTPSWGCSPFTGIGLATACFDASGEPYRCGTARGPVVTNAQGVSMGTPHVVYQTNAFRLTYQQFTDIYEATGSAYNSLTPSPTPLLQRSVLNATVPWVDDELFNPSTVCNDDLAGNMDLAMFVGGRDTSQGQILSGAWGKAVSDRTVVSYMLDSNPQVTWTGANDWRHWEVRKLMNAEGEYVVYYDAKDGSGNNRIFMGVTDPSMTWNDADFGGSRCL